MYNGVLFIIFEFDLILYKGVNMVRDEVLVVFFSNIEYFVAA